MPTAEQLSQQHLDDDKGEDEDEPLLANELTRWCCFRDQALEARYRRQSMLTTSKARMLNAAIFALIAVLKLSTAVALLQEAWTPRETSLCVFSSACIGMSCAFLSKAFRSLQPNTQFNVVTAGLSAFAAYQPVHFEYRLALLAGSNPGRCIRDAGKIDCEITNSVLSMRSCAWLALLLVQDLDIRRYAIIISTSVLAKIYWQLRMPLPGGFAQFGPAMLVHITVVSLVLLVKLRTNVTARRSYLFRIKMREQSTKLASEILKASVAEAAQVARSRLIRVVHARMPQQRPLARAAKARPARFCGTQRAHSFTGLTLCRSRFTLPR